MKVRERVKLTYEYLASLKENQAVLNDLDWFTFIVSLIPIEGVKQIGQVANKLTSDKRINARFKALHKRVFKLDEKIDELKSDAKRIQAIAKAIESSSDVKSEIDDFISLVSKKLEEEDTEFLIETTNWSTQAIIKQIIEVDWAAIIAQNHSHNYLKDTKIKARKTHLKADNHSSNVIDGTDFTDGKGTVSMKGITQKGDVSVSGTSIGFGAGGGSISFGPPPGTLTGNCPKCNVTLQVHKSQIAGYSSIKCYSCGAVLPFQIR